MNALRMLGGIELSGVNGTEVDALLRQPKLMALLAYLAMPRPGTWHRRDSLLAAFWPDFNESRARTSLRNALYTLRQHLDEGVVRTRGVDEVSVDPDLITTDVAVMLDHMSADRHAEALALYRGDLLPALYIADADGFEQWLEQERARLKGAARKAATLLSEGRERSGDLAGAIEATLRGAELDPDDETTVRRQIALLDRAGDRSQALAVFERLRRRTREQYGVEPSNETLALVAGIRARQSNVPTAVESHRADDAVVDLNAEVPREGVAPGVPAAPVVASPPAVDPPRSPPSSMRSRARRSGLAAGVLVVVTALLLVVHGRTAESGAAVSRRLVVLPMDNATGDSSLDYVATGMADEIARRLEGIGGIIVRSGARSEWPATTRHDFQTIGARFGSTILLRTTLTRTQTDSLEVNTAVVDVASSTEKQIASRRFTTGNLLAAGGEMAALVAGVIFRAPIPATPHTGTAPVAPESYRLMLIGWQHQLGTKQLLLARQAFEQAIAIDPTNVRAWAGLSSALSAMATSQLIPIESGYDQSEAAANHALALDSLEGTALANVGFIRAFRERNLAIGLEWIHHAERVDPSNAEVFLLESSLYRHAWLWDQARGAAQIARQLDPLAPYFLEREAVLDLCADRPADALGLYESELTILPSNKPAQDGRVRALAHLGRYDDALAAWRNYATLAADSALVARLTEAHGESGFWAVRHFDGGRRLRQVQMKADKGWVGPWVLLTTHFAAGEIDTAFAELDAAVRDRDYALYRLPCQPDFDEVRQTARFRAIMNRVGPLPKG